LSHPFIITGLPRSRTAWLAAVATTQPGAICHHEPSAAWGHWTPVFDLWEQSKYLYTGVSDSVMGFHLGEVFEAYPDVPVLIVERDIDEVQVSLSNLGGLAATNYCALLQSALEPFRCHQNVARVDYDALGDSDVVALCLRHLLPNAAIDVGKIETLQHFNVQTDMTRLHHLARNVTVPMVRDLMGDAAEHLVTRVA